MATPIVRCLAESKIISTVIDICPPLMHAPLVVNVPLLTSIFPQLACFSGHSSFNTIATSQTFPQLWCLHRDCERDSLLTMIGGR